MYAAHHRAQKHREAAARHRIKHPKAVAENSRRWRKRNPEKSKETNGYSRKRYLKYEFNTTEEEVNSIIESQGGLCKICQRPRKLQVDHDHTTGQIRGMLCGQCNKGIGLLGDTK